MTKKKQKKKKISHKPPVKKKSTKSAAGRPPLADDQRRDHSLRFRTTAAETDMLELATRLCNFRQRSRWAMTRLLFLARSVLKNAKIDPNDPKAVKRALRRIPRVDN